VSDNRNRDPRARDGETFTRAGFLRATAVLGTGIIATTAGIGCGSGGGTGTSATSAVAGRPRVGGTFRVGVSGTGSSETADANVFVNRSDAVRMNNIYAQLVDGWSPRLGVHYDLAEEITPNPDGTVWTIRLVEGAEFHNGKTVSADDVIFTLRRIIGKKTLVASHIAYVDPNRLRKLDDRTVRLTLKTPTGLLREGLMEIGTGIVPVGYDPRHPVGAGPFKLTSFAKGQRTVLTRFENFHGDGPYFDEVVIIDFDDDAARVNAMVSREVDAIEQVPAAQVRVLQGTQGVKLVRSNTGSPMLFTMRTDSAPFQDVRVRQAMRLIADRPQLIAQSLAGYGSIGNDVMASHYDPDYASDLPQRHQDLAQAKSLLASAGQSDLRVELATAPIAAGYVQAAQVLAQQAKAAGVTVSVRTLDNQSFNAGYLRWAFAPDTYSVHPYLTDAQLFLVPGGVVNPTHWDDKEFRSILANASKETDSAKRSDMTKQLQRIEYERGGNLVWGFPDIFDAVASNVQGFVPDPYGLGFDGYDFKRGWFA